jgi:hypothetical protein
MKVCQLVMTLRLLRGRPRATRRKARPFPSLALGLLLGALVVVVPPNEPRASAQAALAPPECNDHTEHGPAGLTIRRPYERGKIPVVLVHGLWGSERQWDRMVRDLEEREVIRETARIPAEHIRMSGKDSSHLVLGVAEPRGESWAKGQSGSETPVTEGMP